MSEKEKRELDAWLAVALFGWVRTDIKCGPTDNRSIGGALYSPNGFNGDCNQASAVPQYTYDLAAAMIVWIACLERCDAESAKVPSGYRIRRTDVGKDCLTTFGSTLPIVIALFARKLYSSTEG